MKWSIQQLLKIQKFPYPFSAEFDFSPYVDTIEDILEIKKTSVTGNIYKVDDETYRFVYKVNVDLVLQCALTLDPVDYHMENEYDEVYSKKENEDFFLIEKNTIDLEEMVWANILIEKPINVTLPNAYEILKERGIVLDDSIELEDDEQVLFYTSGDEDEEE